MRLATIRTGAGTRAVKQHGDELIDLGAADLGHLLDDPHWRSRAAEGGDISYSVDGPEFLGFAPVVPVPSKIICVGLNYRTHITEMGRELPEYPTLFAKFADCLIGASDDILRPDETEQFDWEAELALVVGTPARRVSGLDAEASIAGFTVLNDITCRDWQFRTREWLQGKMWDSSTPVGPWLVTPDELPGGVRPDLPIRLTVDGETMQDDTTGDLLFDPVHLVAYVSTIVRLNPGDIIATGTPGGVGHARQPPRFLAGGERLVAEIDGLGRLENVVVRDHSI